MDLSGTISGAFRLSAPPPPPPPPKPSIPLVGEDRGGRLGLLRSLVDARVGTGISLCVCVCVCVCVRMCVRVFVFNDTVRASWLTNESMSARK